ncbi:hypothetical protein DJ533_00415 (plasmid) [Acinetobacter defluvii]|uniref:Uncharacterized protein n=1 Tax=Acinetobacter defluvii TaxID=1871111 RepID=A0A2S2F872_9GAMM|nr:hypothetical protein [Acinetobacter defluvii]AWL27181.1 hypothetical protein DJ533_00415 [Acinetobacter defluvii]
MINFFLKLFSSISVLPNDDFSKTFTHNPDELAEKAMEKTADQMKEALKTYSLEHPEVKNNIENLE